jgi:hypothetical protein
VNYTVQIQVEADSLEEAHDTVSGWDLGDAKVQAIMGQPETWTPDPEPPDQPEATS